MLKKEVMNKILEYVYQKPRTVQEIAELLKKNWRTANRYVEIIEQEEGLLATRVFRGGTRGALKVVFYNHQEQVKSNYVQEVLFKQIMQGRSKHDFSPFDIYQYAEKRHAFIDQVKKEKTNTQEIISFLKSAKEQILCFSGNLSWLNLKEKDNAVIDTLKELVKNKVNIKMVSRVDQATISNLNKILHLNTEFPKNAIDIRHHEQPLRGFIVDNKVIRLKEEKDPRKYKEKELEKRSLTFYEIYDEEWVSWSQKVFWNMFRSSIPAEKRLVDLESIQNLR